MKNWWTKKYFVVVVVFFVVWNFFPRSNFLSINNNFGIDLLRYGYGYHCHNIHRHFSYFLWLILVSAFAEKKRTAKLNINEYKNKRKYIFFLVVFVITNRKSHSEKTLHLFEWKRARRIASIFLCCLFIWFYFFSSFFFIHFFSEGNVDVLGSKEIPIVAHTQPPYRILYTHNR